LPTVWAPSDYQAASYFYGGIIMLKKSLAEELSSTTYPGRGIVIGKTPDGKKAAIAYFIMGRSENSRNRILK